MQIYIYVYIDIYVWSYTNNRSVVHLDSDCTQHPSAVPRGPGSSSLWSPVVLGKLGFLSFVLRDQEQHQCGRTWNHRALGGAGHHSGRLHTLHRALVCHPPEQHLSGRAVSAQHSCSLQPKHLLCHGHSAVAARTEPQRALRSQPPAPLSDTSSLSHCIQTSWCHSAKSWFFRAGWAFVFHL